jgi:hypothetical protein
MTQYIPSAARTKEGVEKWKYLYTPYCCDLIFEPGAIIVGETEELNLTIWLSWWEAEDKER